MAATRSDADQRRWAAQGLTAIATQAGLSLLGRLLQQRPTQVAVLPIDWQQWCKAYPKSLELPLFEKVVEGLSGPAASSKERDAILAAPPAERQAMLEVYLRGQVARILQLPADKLDLQQPLKSVGLDSLMAIELKNLAEMNLAVEIPAVKLLEGPSIAQLAAELAGQLGGTARDSTDRPSTVDEGRAENWIAYHQPRPEPRLRLFCFHYLGGGASAFRQWQEVLPAEIEVCPVQLPGREGRIQEPAFEDLQQLADTLTESLQPWLDRPFAIYGHSMGSLIGFEWARRVRQRYGMSPQHFFAAAYFAPHAPGPNQTRKEWQQAELLEVVQRVLDVPEAVLANPEFMQALLPTIQADSRLVASYRYQAEAPLECPISAFGGLEDPEIAQSDLALWREHTEGEFRLEMFPGRHLFLLDGREQVVAAVARELKAAALKETATLELSPTER